MMSGSSSNRHAEVFALVEVDVWAFELPMPALVEVDVDVCVLAVPEPPAEFADELVDVDACAPDPVVEQPAPLELPAEVDEFEPVLD